MRETGTQTRRLSAGAEWDKSFRDGIGGEYKFSASVRADGYSVNNLSNISNPDLPSALLRNQRDAKPTQRINYNFRRRAASSRSLG